MILRYDTEKLMLFGTIKAVCPDGNMAVTNALFGLYAQYSTDSKLVVRIITTVFYSIITLVITCMQGT